LFRSRSSLYWLLALLLLIWSSNFIFTKYALRELPVPMVIGLRYLLSGVCMLPVVMMGRRDPKWHEHAITTRKLGAIVAVGVLGLVGNQVLFVIGISMTSVAHAAMITALSPVLVMLGSALWGLERITLIRTAGVVVAASGVVVLQFSRGGTGGAHWSGDLIMVMSVIVFAGFNLLGKPVAEQFGSMRMNAISYAAAAVLAVPLVVWKWSESAGASPVAWMGVGYMAVASSVLGYLIYAHALRHLPASRVAVVLYLQPLLASLLAILILSERPGAAFIPASVLVLGGVWMVERHD
jgi:drug/metabolite transporter (DMT)-like permease